MSIITQGIAPLSLAGGGANLSVFYYAVGGVGTATWNPPGVDITPVAVGPVVLQTDTALPFNPGGPTPTSGTGNPAAGGVPTLFIGMTFTIPSMVAAPQGVMGGYFDIRRV